MMDPDKYAKNQSIAPESNRKTIQAVTALLLMLLGLIGISVEFFKPSGGILALFAFVTASAFNMVLAGMIAVSLYAFHRYISHVKAQKNKKAGNAPMFFMMLIGVYYVFRLVTTGGF